VQRLFIPVSVIVGQIGRVAGQRVFRHVWNFIDDKEPPQPKHQQIGSWPRLLVASALQGAVGQITRAVIDRNTRQAFHSVTGSWPGERRPDQNV
jgi:hypothetical protein